MTLPALFTARLRLSPATTDDVDALWALWRDPDVRRYLFDEVPVTRERTTEVLHSVLAGVNEGLGLWMVTSGEASGAVGCVALRRIDAAMGYDPSLTGAVEPVVALAPAVWRRGYGREAVARVLAYGFDALGLPAMAAVTDVPNTASDRLLRHLGFVATGEFDGPRYRARMHALARERFASAPDL